MDYHWTGKAKHFEGIWPLTYIKYEIARNDFRIAVKAIGHIKTEDDDEDDDLFLVLNTKHTLVTEETAMKIITEETAMKIITEEKAKENN